MPYGCTCTRRSCVCCFQIYFQQVRVLKSYDVSIFCPCHSCKVHTLLRFLAVLHQHHTEKKHFIEWLDWLRITLISEASQPLHKFCCGHPAWIQSDVRFVAPRLANLEASELLSDSRWMCLMPPFSLHQVVGKWWAKSMWEVKMLKHCMVPVPARTSTTAGPFLLPFSEVIWSLRVANGVAKACEGTAKRFQSKKSQSSGDKHGAQG